MEGKGVVGKGDWKRGRRIICDLGNCFARKDEWASGDFIAPAQSDAQRKGEGGTGDLGIAEVKHSKLIKPQNIIIIRLCHRSDWAS